MVKYGFAFSSFVIARVLLDFETVIPLSLSLFQLFWTKYLDCVEMFWMKIFVTFLNNTQRNGIESAKG